jgi:hypothetical protein
MPGTRLREIFEALGAWGFRGILLAAASVRVVIDIKLFNCNDLHRTTPHSRNEVAADPGMGHRSRTDYLPNRLPLGRHL